LTFHPFRLPGEVVLLNGQKTDSTLQTNLLHR
jgi:hypothetical protein